MTCHHSIKRRVRVDWLRFIIRMDLNDLNDLKDIKDFKDFNDLKDIKDPKDFKDLKSESALKITI